MEQEVSIQTLVISVFTSFLGSLLFFYYLRGRETRIRSKIAELELEEEFLDRIKKGNVELIRSGFKVICMSLFLVFSSGALMFWVKLFIKNQIVFLGAQYLATILWFIAAGMCFYYYKTLSKLKDIKAAKEKLADSRQKLESKL